MYYVYIIKSVSYQGQCYVGYTLNIGQRLEKHNSGESVYTKDYCPWQLVWYCAFKEKIKALNFEKYLKSHSGRAFMQKRFF